MIISHVIGGIGNQMFQYAAGLALSYKLGMSFKLDISDFDSYQLHNGFELNNVFDISAAVATKEDLFKLLNWQANIRIKKLIRQSSLSFIRNKQYIKEPHFQYWPNFTKIGQSSYLYGYWQSEKYFLEYADKIRNEFEFKKPLNDLNIELSNTIKTSNSISIHIRRGDYISNKVNASVFAECNINYYESAISLIVDKISNPHFYIFSNDFEWVKSELKVSHPHTYVEHNQGEESYIDMQLMSYCKHNIIANSSFSWWGAWLNGNKNKIIICPKNWFSNSLDAKDLCLSNWIAI